MLVAERAASLLRIRVENDIDPDGRPRSGSGIGLENVRQRLAAAYGVEASVHWTRDKNTFRVDMMLPADTGGE